MPNLVITAKRKDTSKDWCYTTKEDWNKYFTQEQINTVLQPCYDKVANLPGFLGVDLNFVDSNTMTMTYKFDTAEHCAAGVAARYDHTDSLISQRRTLYENKRKEMGIADDDYTFEAHIV